MFSSISPAPAIAPMGPLPKRLARTRLGPAADLELVLELGELDAAADVGEGVGMTLSFSQDDELLLGGRRRGFDGELGLVVMAGFPPGEALVLRKASSRCLASAWARWFCAE
jgi:hypothetical protein